MYVQNEVFGSYYQKTPTSGSKTLPRVMSAKRPSPSVPHMKHQAPGIAVLVGLKGQTALKYDNRAVQTFLMPVLACEEYVRIPAH